MGSITDSVTEKTEFVAVSFPKQEKMADIYSNRRKDFRYFGEYRHRPGSKGPAHRKEQIRMKANQIHVNYFTSTYQDFIKSLEVPKTDFDSQVKTAYEAKGQSQAESVSAVSESTQDMTMEEYKEYIYDTIAGLRMHPSQYRNTVSVYISDAGFEAMKNDPEYEAWVLDTLKKNFSFNDPWGPMNGGNYVVHSFGATKEEYHGYSQPKESRKSLRKKMEENYWEERRKRRKELNKKYYEELMERKAMIRRLQQKLFIEKDISWAEAANEAKKRVPVSCFRGIK